MIVLSALDGVLGSFWDQWILFFLDGEGGERRADENGMAWGNGSENNAEMGWEWELLGAFEGPRERWDGMGGEGSLCAGSRRYHRKLSYLYSKWQTPGNE